MFTKVSLTATVAAFLATSTVFIATQLQAAQLSWPEVLQLDGVDGHPNTNHSDRLQLTKGSHLLVVPYCNLFRYSADDAGTWVTSEPLYLQVNVGDQKQVSLNLPALNDAATAKAYLRRPFVNVIDINNNINKLPPQREAGIIAD